MTYQIPDVDSARDRPASETETEIEITPEMIGRGVEFMEGHFVSSFTTSVYQPDFVKSFLEAAIRGGGRSRKRSDSS